MNNSATPNTVSSTIRAATSVVGLLPQLAALVAGLSAIALFTGWREASSYYSELGAPWAAAMLTPSRLIQTSVGLVTMIGLFALISVYWLTQHSATATHLRWWSIGITVAASVLYFIYTLGGAPSYWLSVSATYLCGLGAAQLFAISAGLNIGEIIAGLAKRELKWNGYDFGLLTNYVLVYGILMAPNINGTAKAHLDVDLQSSRLPVVSIATATPGRVWKLVGPLDSSFLVVSLATASEDRVFRILPAKDLTEIQSSKVK